MVSICDMARYGNGELNPAHLPGIIRDEFEAHLPKRGGKPVSPPAPA